MDNVIDSLQIEIQSNAANVSGQIDSLVKAIRRLDKVGQSTGLVSLHKNLKKLTSLNFSSLRSQLTGIANALKTISSFKSFLKEKGGVVPDIPVTPPTPPVDGADVGGGAGGVTTELDSITEEAQEVNEQFRLLGESGGDALGTLSTKLEAVERLCNLTVQKAQFLGQEWQKALQEFGADDIRTVNAEMAFRNAEKSARSLQDQVESLRNELNNTKGANKFGKSIGKMFDSLKRIAFYRLIRTIISSLTNAIKDGLENVAKYSEEANKTMSNLSATGKYISNTLGAALIPALQTLTPIINGLAEAFVFCTNGLNMFFSVIQGKDTYTKAIKNNEDYAESLKKIQNATAGIDELNVISDNSETVDYSEMFEETKLSMKDIALNMTALTGLLVALAALPAVFGKIEWGTFAKIAGILVAIEGLFLSITSFIEIWNDGATWENMTTSLIGIAALVGGLTLAFGQWGLFIGAIVGAIALLVINIKDVITNGVNLKNLIPILVAIAGLVVVIGFAIGWLPALIVGIVAAVAFVVGVIIHYWDNIAAWFKKVWGKISDFFKMGWEKVTDFAKKAGEKIKGAWNTVAEFFTYIFTTAWEGVKFAWSEVKGFFVGLWEDIKGVWNVVASWFTSKFTAAWNGIKTAWATVKDFFVGLWEDIKAIFAKVGEFFVTAFTTAREGVKTAWSSVKEFFSGIWEGIKGVFSSVGTFFSTAFTTAVTGIKNAWGKIGEFFSGIWDGIAKGFYSVINGIITGFESFVNLFVKGINWIIGCLNKISFSLPDWIPGIGGTTFGINIALVKEVSLGRVGGYAQGGFPEDDSLIYVNPYELVGKMSNGKNVVANNEQITEGIKRATYEAMVEASRDGSNNGSNTDNIEIKVYLDGRQITAAVEKNQRGKGVGESIYKGGVLNGI